MAGLRALSLKAWNTGALLRELLEPTGVYPRRRSLKRPTAAALLSDYAAAQQWAAELFARAGPYALETVEVGPPHGGLQPDSGGGSFRDGGG